MGKNEEVRISGRTIQECSQSLTAALNLLPHETRKHLKAIWLNYSAGYGLEEACQRVNNRTIAQIFEEYRPAPVQEIKSGEVDGVSYVLSGPLQKSAEEINQAETRKDSVADVHAIRVSGGTFRECEDSWRAASKLLPPDLQEQWQAIYSDYCRAYGMDGFYQRVSNRTASQILAEYPTVFAQMSRELSGVSDSTASEIDDLLAVAENPETIRICGSSFAEFSKSLGALRRVLSPESDDRLSGLLPIYQIGYGYLGSYQRMNNRTLEEIFADPIPTVGGDLTLESR